MVGGSPEGRGVVAAASYEARKFGIRSAMPMRTALQRCAELIRVNARFDRYGEVSRQVMAIFRDLTPLVEPLSLDEAFLDITELVGRDQAPSRLALQLKRRVQAEIGLTVSVGVATSKSVSKIASDMDKPDGLTVVAPGSEREFLAPLKVSKLWGIGPKTEPRLARDGVVTIGDMATRPEEWFRARFGRSGPFMRLLSVGEDHRAVEVRRDRKSVSAETTLAIDTDDREALLELVNRLSERVSGHLERREMEGRTVKLKLRLADFTTFTRQKTGARPVRSSEDVVGVASDLMLAELRPGRFFRLVGVGVSGFERPGEDAQPLQPRLAGFE